MAPLLFPRMIAVLWVESQKEGVGFRVELSEKMIPGSTAGLFPESKDGETFPLESRWRSVRLVVDDWRNFEDWD